MSTCCGRHFLFRAFCVAYLGAFDYLPALRAAIYPFGYPAVLGFIILVESRIRRYRLVYITPEFAAKEDMPLTMRSCSSTAKAFVRVANRSACRGFPRAETDLRGASLSTLSRVNLQLIPTSLQAGF